MLILHDYELSSEAYAARLMLGFLGLAHESRPVDVYPGAANEAPAFRRLSPLGRVPVLEDGGLALWDWQAILIHLAATYDESRRWLPQDPARAGAIAQWMAVGRELEDSSGLARRHLAMFVDADLPLAQERAHRLMRQMDEHLWFQEQAGQDWLVDGPHPTLADLAPFPAVMLSEEGGVDRRDYPAIRRWSERFRRTPGFVTMSGVFPAAPLG
ncbi:glutathione S-transferase family protein [Methylopila turkensis]|uniref:Glutathione S-transferase n=1 Tax=Methylopila turkensis TaxID=1437816 RepID=A0A9W6JIU6_9HYPH|nr:glutathione S-transferase family protein [Methylopila turkensis]GLK78466.1 glutathione S-transferase [Methylopila turkensis]